MRKPEKKGFVNGKLEKFRVVGQHLMEHPACANERPRLNTLKNMMQVLCHVFLRVKGSAWITA